MVASPRTPRIYADTSVFGGCFDAQFEKTSLRLFDRIRSGRLHLVVSDVVMRELERSPERVRQVLADVPDRQIERAALTEESIELRDEYLAVGVLGPRWMDDAAHVAVATVASVDAVVSWNFRHIVNLNRIRGFNS